MVQVKTKSASALLMPEDVRRIRTGLGLTQVEAGELLGGGPRAFQKYESGTVTPAATTANLLRLLEANPGSLAALTGKKAKALETQALRPFEVSGEHIRALSDRKFVLLMRRLLSAEAQANDIPRSCLHVASNLTAADGGEDARIVWRGGVERTDFLPGRASLFQVKAADVSPSSAAADVLTKSKTLEPAIEELLKGGGFYLILCNRPFTYQEIERREKAVRKAVRGSGLSVADEQVVFRDADQVAVWANAHPSTATWVLEQTQPGLGGPLRTWGHWAGAHEHERVPYIEDPRLPALRDRLRAGLSEPRGVVRLVGMSGVGKSRLALEALGPTDEEDSSKVYLSDLVLYAVEANVGPTAIKAAVQTLVDLGIRSIIVIDRCPADTHQTLAGMVRRLSSRVSLLTIDHEIPASPTPDIDILESAPATVTEGILKAVAPGLPSEDQRRLAQFAKGYPQLAAMLGEAWLADIPVATATDATLIDRVVLGRAGIAPEKSVTVKAAMLVSAISLLGFREKVEPELDLAAAFSGGLSKADLKSAIEDLRRRGVIQLRGRYATLEPRPIATALAERRWSEWSPDIWDELLARSSFSVRLSQRLTLLNQSEIAKRVVCHLCRRAGPFDSLEAVNLGANAEVISNFAEIDSDSVADLLNRILGPMTVEQLRGIVGQQRRQIVHAVEKVAFVPETFEDGATLMMKLALAENETWGNNATGQFCDFFPVMLGETAADGNARLALLDSLIETEDKQQLLLLVRALSRGTKTHHFSRIVGSESHGLRPAYEPWMPATVREVADYIQAFLDRLLGLAKRGDEVGEKAMDLLAAELRALIGAGFLDFVEKATHELVEILGGWPSAVASLGHTLVYDLKDPNAEDRIRVQELMRLLKPQDVESRIQRLVTEMPWDYPCDEPLDLDTQERKQREAIELLVDDLLKQPNQLREAIRRISVGEHRMAQPFGRALAERSTEPLSWAWPVVMAFRRAPEQERNGSLLVGFSVGLASRAPAAVSAFKKAAMKSRVFARLVPHITLIVGITADDVELVRGGVKTNILPVGALSVWSMGGVLAKQPPEVVAPLFSDLISEDPEPWTVAVNLIGMYAHSDPARLEKLRPQIRQLAETSGGAGIRANTMSDHHFQRIMTWMLKRGQTDNDARAVALTLTRVLVAEAEADGFLRTHRVTPLIPILLQEFPEVVWSLISKAIAADPKATWRFEFALGDRTIGDGGKTSALLNLPPDSLFAWCHAHPEVGPAFLAASIPLLSAADESGKRQLHPIIKRLVDEFGERQDVQSGIVRNIYTFGWIGSMADYYRIYLPVFEGLTSHPKLSVRRWVKIVLKGLEGQIETEKQHDDERNALWGS